jgi:hypothetical protein
MRFQELRYNRQVKRFYFSFIPVFSGYIYSVPNWVYEWYFSPSTVTFIQIDHIDLEEKPVDVFLSLHINQENLGFVAYSKISPQTSDRRLIYDKNVLPHKKALQLFFKHLVPTRAALKDNWENVEKNLNPQAFLASYE